MPITNAKILMVGTGSPTGQPVTCTDQATSTLLGQGNPDSTSAITLLQSIINGIQAGDGSFAMFLPYGEFFQGTAAGRATGAGGVPGTQAASAAGVAMASGVLTSKQPLAGAAAGQASNAATPAKALAGAAAGTGTASAATPTVAGGSNLAGASAGVGGGTAATFLARALIGAAAGTGTAGPGVMSTAAAIAGASAGTGTASASGLTVAGGGGVSVTDNFNRANNVSLGSNWTTAPGLSAPALSTNTAQENANFQRSGAYWSAATFSANQYAEATVGASASTGVTVRQSASAATYYSLEVLDFNDGEGGAWTHAQLFKSIAGVRTQIGSDIVIDAANDHSSLGGYLYLHLEVTGAGAGTLTAKWKIGVGSAWTTGLTIAGDASVGSPGYPGLITYGSSIDDWAAGDL